MKWREIWRDAISIAFRQHPAFYRDGPRSEPTPEGQRAVRRYLATMLALVVALAAFLVYSCVVWGWR